MRRWLRRVDNKFVSHLEGPRGKAHVAAFTFIAFISLVVARAFRGQSEGEDILATGGGVVFIAAIFAYGWHTFRRLRK